MHQHEVYAYDDAGNAVDTVDAIALCSDSCHREYCEANGLAYNGWNGCAESGSDEWCAQCGIRCAIGVDEEIKCGWRCLPVVVQAAGPYVDPTGSETCKHGKRYWIAPTS